MDVWSHIQERSVDQPGVGCQSCSWLAEQGKLISKNDWKTKGRGFNESKKTKNETKLNKT